MNKEFWHSQRGKSLIKLIVWFLFIIVLYVVLTFGMDSPKQNNNNNNNNNNNKVTDKENTENTLLWDLSNREYDYEYLITINGEEYSFKGSKLKDEETGIKTLPNGETINYIKKGNQITNTENEIIPNLYDNLASEFLNYNILMAIITEANCSSAMCNFSYNEYQINVAVISDKELQINIASATASYELKYLVK